MLAIVGGGAMLGVLVTLTRVCRHAGRSIAGNAIPSLDTGAVVSRRIKDRLVRHIGHDADYLSCKGFGRLMTIANRQYIYPARSLSKGEGMIKKLRRLKERGPRALKAKIRSVIQETRDDGHVLLLHNGRSGSTLLGDMLDQHMDIFWDGETIEKMLHRIEQKEQVGIDKLYGALDIDAAIAEIENRLNNRAGNKIFGTELQDYHLKMLETDLETYVGRLKELGFSKFIYLDRSYMRKIVSHIVATKKGRFHIDAAQKAKVRSITIDPEKIYIGHRFTTLLGALRQYRQFRKSAQDIFANEDFLHLTYERDIQSAPEAAVEKVCRFLNLQMHDPDINFGKTTDVPLARVIENYDEIIEVFQDSEFGTEVDRAN